MRPDFSGREKALKMGSHSELALAIVEKRTELMKTFKILKHRGMAVLVAAVLFVPILHAAASASPELNAELAQSLTLYDSDELQAATEKAVGRGADPVQLESLIQRAHSNDLSPEVLADWVSHVEQLAAKQLPVSPVVSRYLQGLAKHIATSRIMVAVGELESRLDEAAMHIDAVCRVPGDPASQRERLATIDHGAYVLGLGVTGRQLDLAISLAWEESNSIEAIEAPILTLGILVASGISADQSMEVVDAAWVHGYRGVNLERLGKALGRLGREGDGPPAEIVADVLEMIGNGASQDRVFQDLDELIGRDELRMSGTVPGEDPTIRRGDPTREGPADAPDGKDDQREPWAERDSY